jgi:hypothetical protein
MPRGLNGRSVSEDRGIDTNAESNYARSLATRTIDVAKILANFNEY